MYIEIGALVTIMMMTNANSEIRKNQKFAMRLESVMIYFGRYIFLISLAEEIIDFMEALVLWLKKPNSNLPVNK